MNNRKIITIHKNNGAFKDSEKIYDFGMDNNGVPDNVDMNLFIFHTLIDMDRKKLININEVRKILDYNYGASFDNVIENMRIIIKGDNSKDNKIIIKDSDKNANTN